MASARIPMRLSAMIWYVLCVISLSVYLCDAVDCNVDSENFKGDKDEYVKYFEECIANKYGFEASNDKKMWTTVPTLESELKSPHLKKTALVAEKFFFNDGSGRKWDKVNELWGKDEACKNMLYVTAARLVYYTYKLVELSGKNDFGMCKKEQGLYVLPDYSCYPVNSGSKRCTSDADVGLVGPKSGELVSKYNKFIKEKFKMTSEELFDNNMYAYSIELAMPELFMAAPGKKEEFEKLKKVLENMDGDVHYQMQDLAFALHKVDIYTLSASDDKFAIGLLAKEYIDQFEIWKEYLNKIINELKKGPDDIDEKTFSSNIYSLLVEEIAKNEKQDYTRMAFLLLSHVYASEAYLSRGALRVVVGGQQMNRESVRQRLTPLDHWCTMIENYGDTMKVYKKECNEATVTVGSCLMKMSKYLWRTFYSAEQLYKSLTINEISDTITDERILSKDEMKVNTMKNFGHESFRATDILKHWIDDFKNRAIKDIEEEYKYEPADPAKANQKLKDVSNGKVNWMEKFFKRVGCYYDKNDKLLAQCMKHISRIIVVFNERMASMTNAGKVAKKDCIDKAC